MKNNFKLIYNQNNQKQKYKQVCNTVMHKIGTLLR